MQEAAEEDETDLGIAKNREPDQRWIIAVLATMRPNCYIFDKGYVPALIDKEVPDDISKAVDNADGFWTGQPMLGTIGKSAKSGYSVLNRMMGDKTEVKLTLAK